MSAPAIWRTDEPCPACGTAVHCTDAADAVTYDCPACGWTAICDLASQREGADDRPDHPRCPRGSSACA